MSSTGSPARIRPDKVTLIAVWFGISAAISLFVAATTLFIFLGLLLPEMTDDPDRGRVIFGLFSGIFLFGGFGVLDIAVVVGLLRLRDWGRWLAMVLAVLGLFFIPVHTIVGVLMIRYLLSDEAKHAFGVAALPEPTPSRTEATPQ